MKTAIVVLEEALNVCVANEPINRKEGNVEQADAEAVSAAGIRQALAILTPAVNGPIWPEPSA